MGRATIVEHLGDALYKVQIHRDSQRVRAVIDKWVAEADSIDAQCVELEAEGSELEAAAAEAKADYEQAQVASEDQAEVNRLLGEYLSALAEWEALANKLFGLQAHARHLRNRAANMEDYLAPRDAEAWCSTYTTNLAPGTEVATIEVARQGDDYPYHVIAPEGRQPTPDDGQMRSVMSMTPAQTFLNYALWPGAVRWYPRYREGTVTDIDKDNQQLQVWLNTPDVPGRQELYSPEWYVFKPLCEGEDTISYKPSDMVVWEQESDTIIGWAREPRECKINTGATISAGMEFRFEDFRSSGQTDHYSEGQIWTGNKYLPAYEQYSYEKKATLRFNGQNMKYFSWWDTTIYQRTVVEQTDDKVVVHQTRTETNIGDMPGFDEEACNDFWADSSDFSGYCDTINSYIANASYNDGTLTGYYFLQTEARPLVFEKLVEYRRLPSGWYSYDIYSERIQQRRVIEGKVYSVTKSLRYLAESRASETYLALDSGAELNGDGVSISAYFGGDNLFGSTFPDGWTTFRYYFSPKIYDTQENIAYALENYNTYQDYFDEYVV